MRIANAMRSLFLKEILEGLLYTHALVIHSAAIMPEAG